MTALRFVVVLAAGLACGCSALTPYPTYPADPVAGHPDPRQRVAVCFNALKTPPETVQQTAQAECYGDTVAERIDTDYVLDFCPLALPGRATFACTPKK